MLSLVSRAKRLCSFAGESIAQRSCEQKKKACDAKGFVGKNHTCIESLEALSDVAQAG